MQSLPRKWYFGIAGLFCLLNLAPPSQPAQSIPSGIKAVKARASATDLLSQGAQDITQGEGVLVCVVDTGVQADHPELIGNVAGGENFVVIKGSLDRSKWADDNGHGTHVSGTIAALDSRGSGSYSAISDGIRSCTAKGAKVIRGLGCIGC
jgi:subtilisin family serine protease